MRNTVWAWLALGVLLVSCGGAGSPGSPPAHSPQSAVIDGGTVTFPNARSTYTVAHGGSGYIVTDHADGTQTSIAATTHSLVFSDVTVNLDIAAKSTTLAEADLKQLIELYIAFFNRVPDADGLAFWIDQFKSGRAIDSIADDFYSAAIVYSSITGYSGSMTNSDFVKIIYKNVLGRSGATAPPDADVAFWAGQLTSGAATRGSLIRFMLGSAHTFLGDATWGWVAQLLDNKYIAGHYLAVTQGLNYNSPADSISQGVAIAAAVTSSSVAPAVRVASTITDTTSWSITVPSSRTLIPTDTYTIPPNPYMLTFETAWQIPRSIEFADFNGDGWIDMVLVPSYGQHLPVLPIEIWLNNGDGSFRNGTAEVFDGAPPLVWNPQQLLLGDFNGDGKPDVFFVETGPENAGTGYHNSLILSQPSGKYADATANIPNNGTAYNHMGGAADANGDGHLDVVWNAIPAVGVEVQSRGIKLVFGDGKGGFTDETARLPMQVRWMTDDDRISLGGQAVLADWQEIGCATLADLDGDGKAEVVTGTYAIPDGWDATGARTVRMFKLGSNGNYAEALRLTIPAAIADIPDGSGTPGRGLGCSQIVSGDFHGTGRKDLLVQWEGAGKWYFELLRNDGNFTFTDVTLEAFGTYNESFVQDGGGAMGPGHYRAVDINGDGKLDLVAQLGGTDADHILGHIGWLNDGAGHFTRWSAQGPNGPLTASDLLSAAKCQNCGYLPLMFDTTGSGIASLVLMDFQSLQTNPTSSQSIENPSQTTGVYLTVFEPAGFR